MKDKGRCTVFLEKVFQSLRRISNLLRLNLHAVHYVFAERFHTDQGSLLVTFTASFTFCWKLDILHLLNDYSLGQVWQNFIVVQSQTRFEEFKLTPACQARTNLLEENRGIDFIRRIILRKAKSQQWTKCGHRNFSSKILFV